MLDTARFSLHGNRLFGREFHYSGQVDQITVITVSMSATGGVAKFNSIDLVIGKVG